MSDKALELITMKRQNAVNQVKKSNRIYFIFSFMTLLFYFIFGGEGASYSFYEMRHWQLNEISQYPLTASKANQKIKNLMNINFFINKWNQNK